MLRPLFTPCLRLAFSASLVLALLTACTDPPDLDDRVSPDLEQADYPTLVPVEQILGQAVSDPQEDVETAERLEARAAGLNARARQLQGTGIDPETRRRLGGSGI